jgi:sarcosine oxidase subunit alpha
MRLRLEKGFLHVGADTEATTWPQDLGHGAGGMDGIDFVGRRSTLRIGFGPRRQLVGLETLDARQPIAQGSHIVSTSKSSRRRRSEGWVTSSGFSPTLGRWVALALVENGAQRLGEVVRLYDRGRETAARVRPACSYDPPGTRLNA